MNNDAKYMILIPQFRVFLQVVSSQKKQRNQTIISPGSVVLFLLLYVKNLSIGTYRVRSNPNLSMLDTNLTPERICRYVTALAMIVAFMPPLLLTWSM